MTQPIRQFATGATRDANADKIAYDRFLSPLVIKRFGQYMHGKRKMPDGSIREPDNWQKGIPLDAYAESGFRHAIDFWAAHFGYPTDSGDDIETELCALIFNAQGYLHELLKAKKAQAQWRIATNDELDAIRYRRLRENWLDSDEIELHGRTAVIDAKVDGLLLCSHPMASESLRDEYERDENSTGV